AVEGLERKRAARQSEITAHAEVPSFSADESAKIVVAGLAPSAALDPLELTKHVSSVFRAYPEIQKSSVRFSETSVRRRFVSSDGGLVVEPSRTVGIELECQTQADDGMILERSVFLPAGEAGAVEGQAAAAAKRMGTELVELRGAKVATDYSGPVL